MKKEGIPLFQCPCCISNPHSIHLDGNKKLYHYNKVPRYIVYMCSVLSYVEYANSLEETASLIIRKISLSNVKVIVIYC